MLDLAARLSAVRTSCQALASNCRSGRSITVSSATWTWRQPRALVWGSTARVEENMHRTQPCVSQVWANSRMDPATDSGAPSPSAIAVPLLTW